MRRPFVGAPRSPACLLVSAALLIAAAISVQADCTRTLELATALPIATGANPSSVVAIDVNGDSHLDLVVANSARSGPASDSGSVAVLLGNGNGTFAPPVLYTAGYKPYDVKVADLDLDGHLDLVTANQGSNDVTVLLGRGDGTFWRYRSFSMFSTGPTSLLLADFTGDGLPEIVVACIANTRVISLRNLGGGRFGTPTANFSASSGPLGMHAVDLDGDGHSDLVITANGSNSIITMLSNGDGTFQAQVPHATGPGPVDVLIRDQNGDGRPDWIVPCQTDATVRTHYGLAGGGFAAGIVTSVAGIPNGIAAADLDADGRMDMVLPLANGLTQVLGANAPGAPTPFTAQPPVASASQPCAVATGDFDEDGIPDAVVALLSGGGVALLRGKCAGPPPPPPPPPAPALPLSILWEPMGRALVVTNGAQISPVACSDSAGGAFLAWYDQSIPGVTSLMALHIDANAHVATGWPAGGISLASGVVDALQIVADGLGGAVALWRDQRSGSLQPFAQHLLASVPIDPTWPPTGASVCSDVTSAKSELRIASDLAGGVYVSWSDSRPEQMFLTHLGSAGSIASGWDPAGYAVGNASSPPGYIYYRSPQVASDRAGNVLLTYWTDSQSCFEQCLTFHYGYVRRYGPNRALLGDTQVNQMIYPYAIPNGYGGVMVAWDYDGPYLGQMTAAPGLQWTAFQGASGVGTYLQGAAADGLGGDITLILQTDPALYGHMFVRANRYNGDGSHPSGWDAGARTLCAAPGYRSYASVVGDRAKGAVAIWQDGRDGTWQLYGVHIGQQGDIPVGTEDGQLLCPAPGTRVGTILLPSLGPSALILWQDTRSDDGDLYAQRVTWDAATPAALSLVSSEARPDLVTLRWFSEDRTQRLIIERARDGASWQEVGEVVSDGEGYLTFADRDVHPGERLGYRLASTVDRAAISGTDAWVTVPASWTLALAGAYPNPARQGLRVAFTLPDSWPATLDVFDVTGRRVSRRDVGALGPGPHVSSFDREHLASGVYLLRLAHRGCALTARAIVVR